MKRKQKNNIALIESDIFYKEMYADKELIDIFQLWILRVYFRYLGIKSIFSIRSCYELLCFLGVDKEIEINDDANSQKKIINFLKTKYIKLENRKKFTNHKTLRCNIKKISKLVKLSLYEQKILEFAVLLNEYDILSQVINSIGDNLNNTQTKKIISIILNIPLKEVIKCFSPNSKLTHSSILTLNFYSVSLDCKIAFISNNFSSVMLNSNESIEKMLKEVINKCNYSELNLRDFSHLQKELSVLIPYLKTSIRKNKKGVNILYYGQPGTGKTEFTKVIANKLNQTLYEISYADSDNNPIEGQKRFLAFKSAQSILSNKNTMLMFDEVEDVFSNNSHDISNKRQKYKAWVNKALENNSIPTFWITNNINIIDDAIIRRFDMVIEFPIPEKSKRKKIIAKYSEKQLSEEAILKLSSNETVAPALISRAAKVVGSVKSEDKDEAFEMLIDSTLKAQGYSGIKESSNISLPKTYDPSYINCDIDLSKLSAGISTSQNARICLYGPAGTGKSAYGKYIADSLDKILILKKSSDLFSMWQGETEKNIARAFEEAKDENAVLIFDEVDSFLASRQHATKNWEITQVNEMLVQMENFDGVFIATTNLMDNLDKASLRRFDLKLEFSFLKPEQAWKLFKSECKNIGITKIPHFCKENIKIINYLTPGDFAAVIRQNRFNPIKNTQDFIERLKNEVTVKNIKNSNMIGFMS